MDDAMRCPNCGGQEGEDIIGQEACIGLNDSVSFASVKVSEIMFEVVREDRDGNSVYRCTHCGNHFKYSEVEEYDRTRQAF